MLRAALAVERGAGEADSRERSSIMADHSVRTMRRPSLAMVLAALHCAFLLGVLAGKPFTPYPAASEEEEIMSLNPWKLGGEMVAARSFHHAYESFPVQVLTFVYIPAMLVSGLTVDLLAWKFLHRFHASYVHAASWLLLGSLQWFVIGRMIERKWLRPKAP